MNAIEERLRKFKEKFKTPLIVKTFQTALFKATTKTKLLVFSRSLTGKGNNILYPF